MGAPIHKEICLNGVTPAEVTLIEPWFVGNDVSWSKEYARFLELVDAALNRPLQERFAAFMQAFTPEQEPLPPMPTMS